MPRPARRRRAGRRAVARDGPDVQRPHPGGRVRQPQRPRERLRPPGTGQPVDLQGAPGRHRGRPARHVQALRRPHAPADLQPNGRRSSASRHADPAHRPLAHPSPHHRRAGTSHPRSLRGARVQDGTERAHRLARSGHQPPLAWDDPGTLAWPKSPRPACGTARGYDAHLRAKEPTCAACRAVHAQARREERRVA
jgi:hypothetical protein